MQRPRPPAATALHKEEDSAVSRPAIHQADRPGGPSAGHLRELPLPVHSARLPLLRQEDSPSQYPFRQGSALRGPSPPSCKRRSTSGP